MKLRKQITIISLIILIGYNLMAFIIPSLKNTTFWIAYCFSNLSIIISSLVILHALDEKGINNKFKNMPTVYATWSYLVIQLIMGFVEIYYPINFRYSILINAIILGISIIILLGVNAGKKEIARVEKKVQEKVFFIKDLQADIEILVDKVTDVNAKKELELLVETIRYSDPMSHSKLATIENQITIKVEQLKQIEDTQNIKQICNELQQLFSERNKKAKLYKNQPEEIENPEKPLNFKLIIAIIVSIIVVIILALILYFTVIVPNKQYDDAMKLYNNKQYIQAKEAFNKLGDYKDSEEKQNEIMYIYAEELLNKKEYENAQKEFAKLGDYSNSKDKANEAIYQQAIELFNNKKYEEAQELFSSISEYKDSNDKMKESIYLNAEELLKNKDYSKAAEGFLKLDDYKDSKTKVIEIYNLFGEKDVVYFGKYNGKPIAWQILNTKEHKVLLITKDVIDEMAFNKEYKSTDWESSSIRNWLNNEFYNTFDENEKNRIVKNNNDNVFLLSSDAIKEYKKLSNINMSWWIRTMGNEKTKAMYVTTAGTVNADGDIVTKLHGVRPSIWLNLD